MLVLPLRIPAARWLFSGFNVYQLWVYRVDYHIQLCGVELWIWVEESRAVAGIAGILPDFSSRFLSLCPIIVAIARLLLRSSGCI